MDDFSVSGTMNRWMGEPVGECCSSMNKISTLKRNIDNESFLYLPPQILNISVLLSTVKFSFFTTIENIQCFSHQNNCARSSKSTVDMQDLLSHTLNFLTVTETILLIQNNNLLKSVRDIIIDLFSVWTINNYLRIIFHTVTDCVTLW